MNINFDELKVLTQTNMFTVILGHPCSGKTTTLLNLIDEDTAFITNELSDLSLKVRCKNINLKDKNIKLLSVIDECHIKSEIKKCINDDTIKNILFDCTLMGKRNKMDDIFKLLKHSGKRVAISSQINKHDNSFKLKNNNLIDNTGELYVLVNNALINNPYQVISFR